MKSIYTVTILGFAFILFGCSSTRPPTTNPYYPGYHQRNAEVVSNEYQDWQQEQAIRADQQRVRDSLWNKYYQNMGDRSLFFNQYNYSGQNNWNWYRPYSRRYSHWNGYANYRYGYPYGRSWSFGLGYSNQPWFVDTWWANDYLWDRYYWRSPYYSYYDSWNMQPPFYTAGPFYNPYNTWAPYPYSPYYDYGHNYYGHGGGSSAPVPKDVRPRNRDGFNPGIVGPGGAANIPGATVGTPIVGRPRDTGNKGSVTPAVIDRSKLGNRRPVDRESFRRPVLRQTDSGKSKSNSGTVTRSNRNSSSSGSTSVSSSGSSSRSSGSASSSSKNSGSSGNSRPRNRRR